MKLILSKIKTYFGKLDKLLLFMCIGIAFFAVFIQYTLYENDISSAVTASQYKTQIIAFIVRSAGNGADITAVHPSRNTA